MKPASPHCATRQSAHIIRTIHSLTQSTDFPTTAGHTDVAARCVKTALLYGGKSILEQLVRMETWGQDVIFHSFLFSCKGKVLSVLYNAVVILLRCTKFRGGKFISTWRSTGSATGQMPRSLTRTPLGLDIRQYRRAKCLAGLCIELKVVVKVGLDFLMRRLVICFIAKL